MKKKLIALLMFLVMCSSMVLSVSAKTDMYIHDQDYVLTEDEWNYLEDYARMIEENYGYCVMFSVTSDVSDSGSTEQYAQDMYNAYTDSENGIIVVHNVAEEYYHSYCAGKGEDAFSGAVIEEIMSLYNAANTYYDGIYAYYEAAEVVVEAARDAAEEIPPTVGADASSAETESADFVPVERTLPLVVDNADLLSDEEEKEFNDRLEAFSKEYESEIAILTVEDLEGKTPREYADDFYDYNGFGYGEDDDGMLVLYKPGAEGERELYITTHGTGVDDYWADDFMDSMVEDLKKEDYVSAFNSYIEIAEQAHKFHVSPMWIILGVLFGMLIGFAIAQGMASANKSVKANKDASVYLVSGSMILTGNADNYVTSNLVRVERQSSNKNSTHTSSSGRSHGGGGTSF